MAASASCSSAGAVAVPSDPPSSISYPVPTSIKDGSQTQAIYKEREKKRQQLCAGNQQVWSSGPVSITKALDSSIKKNTAFVKRVKQSIGQDARDALLKDLPLLNLEKYLQELIQAVPEGLSRCLTAKDCFAAAEILSAFHVRFGGKAFSSPLTNALELSLAPPSKTLYQDATAEQKERDEAARVARQRHLLRAVGELALVKAVGHSSESTGAPWLFDVLKHLLATDREHSNAPLLIAILKGLGQSFLAPLDTQDAASGLSDTLNSTLTLGDAVNVDQIQAIDPSSAPLVSPAWQTKFRELIETYFRTLVNRIVKEHRRLQDHDRRNHEAYIRSGQIFEDRQQRYERMTKSFERIREWGCILSELLGVPMPKLDSSEASSNSVGLGVNLDSKSAFDRADEEFVTDQSPWEDQDSQKFYQDIMDLGDVIPPSILAQTTGIGTQAENNGVKADDAKEAAVDTDAAESITASSSPQIDAGPSEKGLKAGPAAQLATLMARLSKMTNRSMIDSAAVDFSFIATKPARHKLVRHLASLPHNRIDLAPYYARLAAVLSRYMPDVGENLTAAVEHEFRNLQRKKNADLTENRIRNARFISELTKFKLTSVHAIFHCIKTCLDDFSGSNIEVLASLLEGCGRYLLRTEETSADMRRMLELLRRKRAAANLDQRQLLLLNNAYYQCNPPERKAIEPKLRQPIELYIRHLVYHVLQKKTIDAVLVQLRKLPWDDAAVHGWLKDAFTRAWRIRFSNIHLLAILVYELDCFHPAFSVEVIDQVLENIRTGMEENIFKHNQRRVATTCYLGELYNYRLINGAVVFEQLWSLATFGHPNGRPWPGQVAPLDAPDDYFRIRLICTLLDTCGACFDRGSLRKKLDDFLVFLNVYVLCKHQPLPMDVDFMLTETLETLRPEWKWKKVFAEAAEALEEVMAANRLKTAQTEAEEASEEGSSDERGTGTKRSEQDGEAGNKQRKARHGANYASSNDDSSNDTTTSASSSISNGSSSSSDSSSNSHSSSGSGGQDSDDEQDELSRHRIDEELAIRKEVDDEFDRELAKMMTERGSSGFTSVQANNASASTQRANLISRTALPSVNAGGHGHSHNSNPSGLSEIGLPLRRKLSEQGAENANQSHMKFALLSKKGSKQVTHEVHVPATAPIAINTRTKQLKEEAERKQLKEKVLAYERNSEFQQSQSDRPPAMQFLHRPHQPQKPQQQAHHQREEAATTKGGQKAVGGDFRIWNSPGF